MTNHESGENVEQRELGPKIVVVGVGGAGGNAVNNMIRSNLEGVIFVVANTDAQALKQSLSPNDHRIQLGLSITRGLGAGSKPDVGRAAAEESADEILKIVDGANMLFITAGMGGGTGTGAAPAIAKIARDAGILTVGVVTRPFTFEGANRAKIAEGGIEDLQQHVDTLLIIPNQNLFRLANENTTFADAFKMADNVLYSGVRGVTDLMIMPGLINLDFADIRAVMSEMGKAMMGTGEAEGDRRALDAAEAAISNPLLDDVSLQGARGVLINITGGYDMTLFEVDEAANRIRDEVDSEANIIFGSTFDERLNGKIRVSVVATGIGVQREHMFKGKDTASVMAFNNRKSNPDNMRAFDEASMKQFAAPDHDIGEPQRMGSAVDDDRIDQQDEYQRKIANEPSKRRTSSFFGKFTSRSKNQRRYDDYDYDTPRQDLPRENQSVPDDAEHDELDIPSCFRKKK
ncbi:MAG: cell division protein FtsZ [Holosporales bacterium]|jgi:cell division protein FtsZ|nr:cell division protein FtsZ [Holosporales bacterium]